jgi:hypothetical protein
VIKAGLKTLRLDPGGLGKSGLLILGCQERDWPGNVVLRADCSAALLESKALRVSTYFGVNIRRFNNQKSWFFRVF